MSTTSTAGKKAARLLWSAIVAAALIVPLLLSLDLVSSRGGDGYGNFWLGAIAYVACVVTSAICMVAGLVRGERPRWLAPIAVVLWLLPMAFLLF